LSAGATASGSLPAMMIAAGLPCAAALMIGICVDAPASVGPLIEFAPPSSLSASSMPECSNSSYGLPSCFGIETVFRPFGISALGLTPPSFAGVAVASPPDAAFSSFVSPHATTTNAATRASAASSARRACGRADFMDPPR
jgi:hypothetical protein